MSGSSEPAVIAAAAAIVVAVVTQIVNVAKSLGDRRYERRLAALKDVQESVLHLREQTGLIGLAVREATRNAQVINGVLNVAVPDNVSLAWQSARARLRVTMSWVDDAQVAAAIAAWRDLVEFNGVSWLDVTNAEEEPAFDAVLNALGQAARSRAGRADRPWLMSWLRR